MVLKVIEYHECYHDTPGFREKLCAYEKEVENTSDSIKGLVKEVRKVISATKEFSKAQLAFADVLGSFSFETVGERSEMEDKILNSFAEFAEHIRTIEEQRERLTDNISIRVCDGLEGFRKSCFSPLKEQKRAFEKTTEQFYGALDKRMGLTIKKKEQVLHDSDKEWDHIKDSYQTQAFQYLECLQAVNERKVFECMEPILGMIRDTFTSYHQAYEESQNLTPLCMDLQYSIQLSRDAFDATIDKAHELMKRVREKGGAIPGVTRGYLYISERKKGALGSWVRHYLEYHEPDDELHMYSINPVGFKGHVSEKDVFKFKMDSCTRCKTEDVDRRFCFEIISSDKRIFLLQTDSLGSRRTWIEALGGKEPTYFDLETLPILDVEVSSEMIKFAQKCIATIEERGLDEEGIYRKSGMQAKISKIVKEVEKGRIERIDFSDETENDVHTVSGCLKYLLAHVLPEPLFTFNKHEELVATGKISNYDERSLKLQGITKDLPQSNQDLLKLLIAHLSLISQHSDKNMMRASNVGVVFGPTLMRPRNETVQSIMNIKYQNIVVQQIIEDNQRILHGTVTITSTPSASTPSINRPFSQIVSSSYRGSSYHPLPKAGPQPRFLENRQTLFIEPGGLELSQDFPNNRSISSMPPRPPQPIRLFANQLDNSGSIKPPPLPDPSRKPVMPGSVRPFSVMVENNNNIKPVLPPKSDLVATASSPFKRRPVHRDKAPLGARNSRGIQESLQSPPTQDSPPSVDNSSPDTPPTPGKPSDNLPTDTVEVPSPPNDATDTPPVTKKSGPREAAGTSKGQKARAIFDCDGENENELCFKKFDVFENVRKSDEPQWLFADLNGKRGLIPENYIEYIV